MTVGQDDHTDVAVDLPTFSLEAGTQLGEYVIEGKIGEGAMGVVFSAVHPTIGKRAAIKVLRAELCEDEHQLERFKDEARVVNQIGHPNIVDIFAFGEMLDGRSYFVMEWLKGETLRQRLARGRMTVEEVSEVIRPLARALEAAHEKGIVHRDLKPENVFLVAVRDEPAQVKLLDFGVAKLNNDAHRLYKTGAGELVGTPMYIAPEQARGGAGVDARADIYSLGAIAFECLCGRPPFLHKNVFEMVTAHLIERPPVPSSIAPGLGRDLDGLILAMLAKEPDERPSLAVVRAALGPLDQTPVPRTVSAPTAVTPVVAPTAETTVVAPVSLALAAEASEGGVPVARRGLAIAVGTIGVLAVAALVFVLLRGSDAVAPADAAAVALALPPPPADAALLPADAEVAVAPPVDAAVEAAIVVPAKPPPPPPPPPPPRLGHVVLVAKGPTTATFHVDGKRVTGRRLDVQLAVGPHVVTVEANGATRTLKLDVTPRGLTQTIVLPEDDHALLPPKP